MNKKIESAFTKNPLVDYELGYSTPIAAEPETEYLSKPEIEKRIREKKPWKKQQKIWTSCKRQKREMKLKYYVVK